MKKTICLMAFLILFSFSPALADDSKATPQDVYDIVLKAYDVVKALGEESFPAFNDPKGEFVYKDTYAMVQRCPDAMMAHPFAMEKLKGFDLTKFPFNEALCDAGEKPGGGWVEYNWPKPGETDPSRKVSYVIKVEGTPYTVMAGIYSDTAKIEDLNKTLR
jgi:cytochrome c